MQIIKADKAGYDRIIQTLLSGGLVIVPSDTVYGAVVDATNEEAVKKLIAFKNRPWGKPISVFVSGREMIRDIVKTNEKQERILDRLLPGPYTVVLPSKHKTSTALESEKGTLGVRLPLYSYVTNLVKLYGKPLTATSANLSGRSPHYSIDSMLNQFPEVKKQLIDLIVDGGKLPRNKPSTIIDISGDEVKMLRKGDLVTTDAVSFTTTSPQETHKVAEYVLSKLTDMSKPSIILLEGDLGAGKTEFMKGVGNVLGIDDIISPTYVITFEYKPAKGPFSMLHHFDLYQIEKDEEYNYLGIEEMLKPGALLCFEWGDRSGHLINMLKEKSHIVYITIKHVSEHERQITVHI